MIQPPAVRLIKPAFLLDAIRKHPTAKPALTAWRQIVSAAAWTQFNDVRTTFSSADNVRVASGRPIVVFNISGNHFRLLCAIHYNHARIYLLRFLTHAEYSRNRWISEL